MFFRRPGLAPWVTFTMFESHQLHVDLQPSANFNLLSNQATRGPCPEKKINKIADKESRAVGKLRLIVFLALLLASVTVCVIIYSLTRKGEMNEFEVQFRGVGERVTKTFDSIATERWGALGALRVAAMAEAIDKDSLWPFVTLSSFERRAATAKRLANTLDIVMYHIVTVENKEKWIEYADEEAPIWM